MKIKTILRYSINNKKTNIYENIYDEDTVCFSILLSGGVQGGTTSRSTGQRMDTRCTWFVGCRTALTWCSIRDMDGLSVIMR